MNSLLLFILGLSAFTCLAQLIRQRRQVVLCRILAGLIALGLLAVILAEEKQDHPAPHPLGDSFSIIAPGGQGEFDRLQIVVRDCFGLIAAKEIAVSAKTQVVTVPLGKLGRVEINLKSPYNACYIDSSKLTHLQRRASASMPFGEYRHQWQAVGVLIGSERAINFVEIYCRPFRSSEIVGKQSRDGFVAQLETIYEAMVSIDYISRKDRQWAELTGSLETPAFSYLPVWHIIFISLFLCLAFPLRMELSFAPSLTLVLVFLIATEKQRLAPLEQVRTSAASTAQAKRDAERLINLSWFHGRSFDATREVRDFRESRYIYDRLQ